MSKKLKFNMIINYGMGETSSSFEKAIYCSNEELTTFDYLIVVDSRGLANNENSFENSYVFLLKKLLDKDNKSYIILSRPKYLTIFTTLYNILELNSHLTFKYLITHLGFVDCTPKKQENISDIILQIKQFSNLDNTIIEHERYKLNDNNYEILKSVEYSTKYIAELQNVLDNKFETCYFINTPIVNQNIEMERVRPNSFFTQLYKTNKLINKIVSLRQNNILIDIKDLDDTYDGVHYTKEGHKKIFNRIKDSLEL